MYGIKELVNGIKRIICPLTDTSSLEKMILIFLSEDIFGF
jgi:hypothetical protein